MRRTQTAIMSAREKQSQTYSFAQKTEHFQHGHTQRVVMMNPSMQEAEHIVTERSEH